MPIVEQYEWADFWWDNADRDGARVLLIGDSIARGYWPAVSAALQGVCFVDRLATSKGRITPHTGMSWTIFSSRLAWPMRRSTSTTVCMPHTCPPQTTAAVWNPSSFICWRRRVTRR